MRKKAVFLEGAYAGIGDCVYLTCSLAAIAKQYERIFLINSVPWIFSDIPEVRVLDPLSKLQSCEEHVSKHMRFGSGGYRDIPAYLMWLMNDPKSKSLYANEDEFLDLGGERTMPRMLCMSDGSGLIPGNKYPVMMVYEMFDSLKNDSSMHPMRVPSDVPSGFYDLARHMLRSVGINNPERTVLTHSFWRYANADQSNFPVRVGSDTEYLTFTRNLKEITGLHFFDLEHFVTGMEGFPSDTPAFHVSGMDGLFITFALIKMCAGVVLQNACRLLPIAQSMNKPCVVFNQGGHSASVFNWGKMGVDDVIVLEPDNLHMCYQVKCAECRRGRYIGNERLNSALDKFIRKLTI